MRDQRQARECRLSEEIDEEYVLKKQQLEEEQRHLLKEVKEQSFKEGSDDENLSLDTSDRNLQQLDTSLKRSGLARKRISAADAAVQCEVRDVDAIGRPKIHTGARNCTNAIKSTCAQVSVKCNKSMECSRIAVKTVCKGLYNHTYYLDRDEAIDSDHNLAEFKDVIPRTKKTKADDKWMKPVTMQDYQLYENVLPSVKTINEHKQTLALQNERNVAIALRDLQPGLKVTLHYEATTRSKINGDWLALILIFSDSL